MSKEVCPVCGSEDFYDIDTQEEYWLHIFGYKYSFTRLHGCLNCGVVYIPKYQLEQIRRYYNDQD